MAKAVRKFTNVKRLIREIRRHPLLFAVGALAVYYLLVVVEW